MGTGNQEGYKLVRDSPGQWEWVQVGMRNS